MVQSQFSNSSFLHVDESVLNIEMVLYESNQRHFIALAILPTLNWETKQNTIIL